MYSTAYTKSIVQILFCNVCILGCGTAFSPLPKHGICIYCVEYTYPQTSKIFWLGKGGKVLKTFLESYMFDSKHKLLGPKIRHFICICYIIPSGSSREAFVETDVLERISNFIIKIANKTNDSYNLLICGDFNCRTGNEQDFVFFFITMPT